MAIYCIKPQPGGAGLTGAVREVPTFCNTDWLLDARDGSQREVALLILRLGPNSTLDYQL